MRETVQASPFGQEIFAESKTMAVFPGEGDMPPLPAHGAESWQTTTLSEETNAFGDTPWLCMLQTITEASVTPKKPEHPRQRLENPTLTVDIHADTPWLDMIEEEPTPLSVTQEEVVETAPTRSTQSPEKRAENQPCPSMQVALLTEAEKQSIRKGVHRFLQNHEEALRVLGWDQNTLFHGMNPTRCENIKNLPGTAALLGYGAKLSHASKAQLTWDLPGRRILQTQKGAFLEKNAAQAAMQGVFQTLAGDAVPKQWITGMAQICSQPAPDDIPDKLWQKLPETLHTFAAQWAAKATALGWDTRTLFGVHNKAAAVRLDAEGVLFGMVRSRCTLKALEKEKATFTTRFGKTQSEQKAMIGASGASWRRLWDPPT